MYKVVGFPSFGIKWIFKIYATALLSIFYFMSTGLIKLLIQIVGHGYPLVIIYIQFYASC